MTPTIISLCSGKGGVGKTIIAANLAKILSEHGQKVLLVDLDFNVRGLTYLLFPKRKIINEYDFSLYALMVEVDPEINLSIEDVSHLAVQLNDKESEKGSRLDIIPSVNKTDEYTDWGRSHSVSPIAARHKLEVIKKYAEKEKYDYIIIDTRAGPDGTSIGAAMISDMVLFVLEQDNVAWKSSLNFLSELGHVEETRWVGESFFLMNKVTKKFTHEQIDALEDMLGLIDFIALIPFVKEVYESFGKGKFIVKDLPDSFFASQISDISIKIDRIRNNSSLEELDLQLLYKGIDKEKVGEEISLFRLVFDRRNRVLVMGAILYLVLGITLLLYNYFESYSFDIFEIGGILFIFMSFLMFLLIVLRGYSKTFK